MTPNWFLISFVPLLIFWRRHGRGCWCFRFIGSGIPRTQTFTSLLPACSMEPVSQFQVETTCLIHLCTSRHHLRVLGIVQHCKKSLACQTGSRSPYWRTLSPLINKNLTLSISRMTKCVEQCPSTFQESFKLMYQKNADDGDNLSLVTMQSEPWNAWHTFYISVSA